MKPSNIIKKTHTFNTNQPQRQQYAPPQHQEYNDDELVEDYVDDEDDYEA